MSSDRFIKENRCRGTVKIEVIGCKGPVHNLVHSLSQAHCLDGRGIVYRQPLSVNPHATAVV